MTHFSGVDTSMPTKLLIVLLFGAAVAKVGPKPPSSFRRASVESVPHWATAFFQNYGSNVDGGKILDTYFGDSISFPNNRYAVEKAPTKEQRSVNALEVMYAHWIL